MHFSVTDLPSQLSRESNQTLKRGEKSGLITLGCLCQGRCFYFHTVLRWTQNSEMKSAKEPAECVHVRPSMCETP